MEVRLKPEECTLVLEGLGELQLKTSMKVYNYVEVMRNLDDKSDTELYIDVEDFDIITAGLGELQAKKVYPLLIKLHAIIGAYENGQRHKEQVDGDQSEVREELGERIGQEDEEGGNNR